MQSKPFNLNYEDIKKIVKNAVIFLAPALLVFLSTYQTTGDVDKAMVALKLWVINTVIDILRRFVRG
jgi:hypothetical protein